MTTFNPPIDGKVRTPEIIKACEATEREIQRLLYALETTTGMSIEHVDIDTRNWGQLKTEITLTTRVRQ